MQFSSEALCTAPLLWLWLSLTLIQQAMGFSAPFQFSDLTTLLLTSFLVSEIDSAEHFQAESCNMEKVLWG